ncbi:DUF4870 domain-containing protein [Virgibacillus alimentarius]|uniref:Tic20 family protein n=1 Tax=Virgibacillus alimentarius TaxID=698769 RepID=A0ABS4S8J0_9BACI|nr:MULTISPECIES: DUF4870 domain-containing protein [Virgibacillus]MBP2257804.1 putative Tic20 family protein [Virgibacillus alimentarius]HLR68403.1 DUF4870 domain-containing protein [Virgibacillus sp.]
MKDGSVREIWMVEIMLGISLLFGFLPPFIMFLKTRKTNMFYREASRKALNFHLTIFPFFFISYFMPAWYTNFIYVVLVIELFFIGYAMIRIARKKSHTYPIAITYIKKNVI